MLPERYKIREFGIRKNALLFKKTSLKSLPSRQAGSPKQRTLTLKQYET